jgi:serine phosphatase RsbU (regulator of sigma subunit)
MATLSPSANWIFTRSWDGSQDAGDFAECIALSPTQRAVVVGDVAGRGSQACAAARALHAYVRSLMLRKAPVVSLLEAADKFFVRSILDDTVAFASLFIAVDDSRLQRMVYGSAGHETALLFARDATGHTHLLPTGPLLGLDFGAPSIFEQNLMDIQNADLLVVVTDGITDARPKQRCAPAFGTAGLVKALAGARRQSCDPAREVYQRATAHASGELNDDSTVLISQLGEAIYPW